MVNIRVTDNIKWLVALFVISAHASLVVGVITVTKENSRVKTKI